MTNHPAAPSRSPPADERVTVSRPTATAVVDAARSR